MSLLIALVPMIAWGSIGLVSGKIGGSANQQTLGMTIGALLFSIVVFFVIQPTLTTATLIVGFISGLFWSLGQNQQFHSMKYMGVSVGLPISTGMQLVVNTVAGAVFFHEWTKTKDFVVGFIALAFLVFGVYLTARQDDDSQPKTSNSMLDFNKGIRALIFSTVGYGVYTIIINATGLDPWGIILPQSIGMLVGASFFAFKKVKVDRFVWMNMTTGLLWGLGNICMLLTMREIGLAISFSLSQMGIIISTLGGIFLLGESKSKKEM
ncbi:MAG: glucose transporter GlcU, partial [Enterococcus sp.]|nr:glucose transporter GlcU [Enterococcus sp.]